MPCTQVSYACLAGVGVIVLLIPANRWLAIKIQRANDRMMVFKDARVKRVGEVLHGIRQIKTAAWEDAFAERVCTPPSFGLGRFQAGDDENDS